MQSGGRKWLAGVRHRSALSCSLSVTPVALLIVRFSVELGELARKATTVCGRGAASRSDCANLWIILCKTLAAIRPATALTLTVAFIEFLDNGSKL